MKNYTVLTLVCLFLSAGAAQSQAPFALSGTITSLQAMEGANKALLDEQQKTLDSLDQIDQDAQQAKILTQRG